MPIIHFYGAVLTKEKKRDLAAKLTEAAATTLPHIPKQAFTVLIHENQPENIAVGGQLLADREGTAK